jgi:transformation/transcription domain-associated protein
VQNSRLLLEGGPRLGGMEDPRLSHAQNLAVIRIYEDSKITRTELTVRLEHAFLIGARAQDVEMRNGQ